jgi:hypothetical protein
MATNSSNSKDIKYINKDFTDFRSALIEYAKAYYPTAYNDFTTASPGSMFIDMAAYVGDVMSFYLDNQIQETFLQYAKQKDNLMTLAYMLGYRPKVTSASTTKLDVYQTVPSYNPTTGSAVPDFRYALIIQEGMQVSANLGGSSKYYTPDSIDFSVSSSSNPTDITVYETDATGERPTKFLLKKSIDIISGEVKTTTIDAPSSRQKFFSTTLVEDNIIEILSITDSDGNLYYEVPYMAQDRILLPRKNTVNVDPNYGGSSIEVPYLIDVLEVPRRFTTRFKADDTLEIQFGAGLTDTSVVTQGQFPDQDFLPNVDRVGLGLINGRSLFFNSYSPSNFVNTRTYGIAPYGTRLTIKYLVGGGAQSNVGSNVINVINNFTSSFFGGITPDATLATDTVNSLVINNPSASSGGGDGDTVDMIRMNSLANFPTQMRAVTQEDYLAMIYSMPSKFGQISKAYITKDSFTYGRQLQAHSELNDPLALSAYVLSYDGNKNLTEPPVALLQNLKTYISQYRMLTDNISLKNGYVINIGLDFDVVLRPNYSSKEVLSSCIQALKDYFSIDKWNINQPIILSDVFTTLDRVVGVQTVKKVDIYNLTDADGNYSQYGYDISGATLGGVIYPSLDPSCFEIKFPDTDIYGRVVTL